MFMNIRFLKHSRKIINRIKKLIFWYSFNYYNLTGKALAPVSIGIDPGNICNLKCPLCPTGSGNLNYKRSFMDLATFKTVIDKIPSLKRISLFNWGEPFLNKEIFEMIKYAKNKKIFVTVHSNFSLKKDNNFFVNIVQSGLDNLTLSIDGAFQARYEKFRVGGDLDLVISNIKTLIDVKNQYQSKKPEIIWKYTINQFNEQEIDVAKKIAAQIGIKFITSKVEVHDMPDAFFDTPITERNQQWLPKNQEYIHELSVNRPCDRLFTSLVVNPDGKVFPCCYLTDENNVFGDLLKDDFQDIWQNDKFRYSRNLFTNKKHSTKPVKTACSQCNRFKHTS